MTANTTAEARPGEPGSRTTATSGSNVSDRAPRQEQFHMRTGPEFFIKIDAWRSGQLGQLGEIPNRSEAVRAMVDIAFDIWEVEKRRKRGKPAPAPALEESVSALEESAPAFEEAAPDHEIRPTPSVTTSSTEALSDADSEAQLASAEAFLKTQTPVATGSGAPAYRETKA